MGKLLKSLIDAEKVPFYVDFRTGSVRSLSGIAANYAPTITSSPKFTSERSMNFASGSLVYANQSDQILTEGTWIIGIKHTNKLPTVYERILCKRSASGISYELYVYNSGGLYTVGYYDGAVHNKALPSGSVYNSLAFTRVGNDYPYVYLDGGKYKYELSNNTGLIGTVTAPITLGAYYDGSLNLHQNISWITVISESLSGADLFTLNNELMQGPTVITKATKHFSFPFPSKTPTQYTADGVLFDLEGKPKFKKILDNVGTYDHSIVGYGSHVLEGPFTNALTLRNSTDYAEFATNINSEVFQGSYSVEAWCKPNSVSVGEGVLLGTPFSNLCGRSGSNLTHVFQNSDETTQQTTATGGVVVGKLSHYVWTVNVDGSNVEVNMYCDGELAESASYTNGFLPYSDGYSTVSINEYSFNPEDLDVWWLDPVGDSGTITNPAQPVLADYDMEAAGVAAWGSYNDPIIETKETTGSSPAGGQYIKVIHDSGTSSWGIRNIGYSNCISGNRYKVIDGWIRGTAANIAVNFAGAGDWYYTVSNTVWNNLSAITDWTGPNSAYGCTIASYQATGTYFELDNLKIANISLAALKAKGTYLNRCCDSMMEYAGTATWTAPTGAVSKETTDPYEGTQCLRVTHNGTNNPQVRQTLIMTPGHLHLFRGYYRGDGLGTAPKVYLGNTLTATGTTSTSWQMFEVTGYPTDTQMYLQGLTTTAGRYAEFDAIEVYDLEDKGGSVYQTTATAQPWIDYETNWVTYDGSADYQYSNLPNCSFDFLHDGREWSFATTHVFNTFATYNTIFANVATSSQFGITIQAGSTGKMGVYIGNGTGAWALATTTDSPVVNPGEPFIITGEYNLTNIRLWINGNLVFDQAPGTLVSGEPSYPMRFGSNLGGNYINGAHADVMIRKSAFADDERQKIERYLSIKHSIPITTAYLTETELETWDGLATWLEPTDESYLTKAAQPNIINPNFDDGTTGWIAELNGVLTAETDDPIDGPYVRVSNTPGAAGFGIKQDNQLIVGNRYVESVYLRGTNGIPVWMTTTFWITDNWTYYSYEWNASVTRFNIANGLTYATSEHFDLDSVSVENLSITAITPRAGSLVDSFSQGTAANQPWQDVSTGWIKFGSATTDVLLGGAASNYKFMHDGTGGSLVTVINLASNSGTQVIAGTSISTGIGFSLYHISGTLYLTVGNGTGYAFNGSIASGIPTGKSIITLRIENALVDVRINGVSKLSGVLTSPSTSNPAYSLGIGNTPTGSSYGINGTIADTLLFDKMLSYTEVIRLEELLATKHGITL